MDRIDELVKVLNIRRDVALEVDEGMYDILIELNKKGWKTSFCCEGHPNNEHRWNAYIAFKDFIPNGIPLYEINKKHNAVHNYSEYKPRINSVYWNGTWSKKWSLEQQDEERKKLMDDLLNWAKELPYREQREYSIYDLYYYDKKGKRKFDGSYYSEQDALNKAQDYDRYDVVFSRKETKYVDSL